MSGSVLVRPNKTSIQNETIFETDSIAAYPSIALKMWHVIYPEEAQNIFYFFNRFVVKQHMNDKRTSIFQRKITKSLR